MVDKIEQLYGALCSLHLLRYRVDEYSVFEICTQELCSLEKASSDLMGQFARSIFSNQLINCDLLRTQIELFETIYNHTLQIVVRDPVIFLFFIQGWYSVIEIIESCSP